MTDEQLNRLFDVAKNESARVSPNEIADWVDVGVKITPHRKKYFLSSLIIGISALLALLMWWVFSNRTAIAHQIKNEKKPTQSVKSNERSSTGIAFQEKRTTPQPHLKKESTIHSSSKQKDSIHTLLIEKESISENIQPKELLSSEPIVPKNESFELTFQPFALHSQKEMRNVLMILDTIRGYRNATKYKMDQTDCYLHLYNDYVVISYQFRGKFFYASGKIHREETVEVNGHVYRAFAFQRDNQATGTNLGKRIFFGYRELEPESNRIEVVMFSQPWAVTTVIKGHFADINERKQLMERSNEQNRKRKN